MTEYKNPVPVVVCLVPVGQGLLVVRRASPGSPGEGQLALPGGYMDLGETWQEAASRELKEETGLVVGPPQWRQFALHMSADKSKLLVFVLGSKIERSELDAFSKNREVSEVDVISCSTVLAFDTHTQVADEWFETEKALSELDIEMAEMAIMAESIKLSGELKDEA